MYCCFSRCLSRLQSRNSGHMADTTLNLHRNIYGDLEHHDAVCCCSGYCGSVVEQSFTRNQCKGVALQLACRVSSTDCSL